MSAGKALGGIVIGVVLLAVLVTVVFSGGDEEWCRPSADIPGGGGVPDGQLSQPIMPADYTVSSEYKSADRPGHRGLDLAAPDGTPMYAMADGVVVESGPATGFGTWMVIDHQIDGELYSTVYGHQWPHGNYVSAGDTVSAGQVIGEVGNNGESTGPHLHLEVWDGGRLSGGTEINPQQWLDRSVEPGSDDGGRAAGSDDNRDASGEDRPRQDGQAEDSNTLFSEENLQRDTVRAGRAVVDRFPDVNTIGGWRADGGGFGDHPEGRAIDAMIPDYQSGEGRELGNRIVNYFLEHADHFRLDYMIWRQEYIAADGTRHKMEDRGDDTQNHYDHVHVTLDGGGPADPEEDFGSPPTGGDDNTSSGGPPDPSDCVDFGHDRDLKSDEIPDELVPWISRGGHTCDAIDSPLLAGLIYHESAGFQANAVSRAGAQGYGQFMPDTWAGKGAEVDEHGEVVGPPGSGSPSDPADATMAAARYLCEIADSQREQIASGQLDGDPQTLMLAGYNAGPGAVEQHGGVPPYAETQKYVVIVPEEAARFAASPQLAD